MVDGIDVGAQLGGGGGGGDDWILLTMSTGFTTPSGGRAAACMNKGDLVYCRGQVSKTASIPFNTDEGFATLPVGMRPSQCAPLPHMCYLHTHP